MASIIERGPNGSVTYKSHRHYNLPDVDLLTLLLDSEHTEARDDTVLHVDAEDTSKYVTKGQSVKLAGQLAHVLQHTYGIGRNGPNTDAVLVVTTGHYLLQTLFFAILSADGVYSAASPASTPSELTYLIGLVEPKLLICNADTKAVVDETIKKTNFPTDRVLFLGDAPSLDLTVISSGKKLPLSPSKTRTWTRITDRKALEDSVACLLFSSGTTGFPKGVKISHRMIVAETFLTAAPSREYNARERLNWECRTLAHVPAAHIAGIQGYFVNITYRGGTTYWMARFDFPKFVAYIKKYQITFFFSVPPIWLAIAKHPDVANYLATVTDGSSGAAPLGAQLQTDAEAKLANGSGILTQVWGLTETTGAITMLDPGQRDYTGSVGALLANHEARIVDDEGKDLEPGVPGEVWVRGPVTFKGYWKNEKADRESFVNGWFCTGDIGVFKEGRLYIVDRKKELIKYKGLQVAPAELEELLLTHPKIVDAAVIGVDGEGTEVPRAYIVTSTKDLTSKDVAEWINGRVANQKKLRGGVIIVDAIPKSPSGKILRKVLREEAKKEAKSSKL